MVRFVSLVAYFSCFFMIACGSESIENRLLPDQGMEDSDASPDQGIIDADVDAGESPDGPNMNDGNEDATTPDEGVDAESNDAATVDAMVDANVPDTTVSDGALVPDANICQIGSEGCGCYGNNTCDAGLACMNDVCRPMEAPPPDGDDDGVSDVSDNCPDVANADQIDTDRDGMGNACDDCEDGTEGCSCFQGRFCDSGFNCNAGICLVAEEPDTDGDSILDGSDNCSLISNPDQIDTDRDGQGDACDNDDDNDDIPDGNDNCSLISNPDQANLDGDSMGDDCDSDDDNDGIADVADNCPLVANADQRDTDRNGIGDACDDPVCPEGTETCPCVNGTFCNEGLTCEDGNCVLDGDGDGVPDNEDNCTLVPNADQMDLDDDGMGDRCQLGWCEDNSHCVGSAWGAYCVADEQYGTGLCQACYYDADDNTVGCGSDAPLCSWGITSESRDGTILLDGYRSVYFCEQCWYDQDCDAGETCQPTEGDWAHTCQPAPDTDGDGITDDVDNCYRDVNPNQADLDGDDVGDVCDWDIDGDGDGNVNDNCPNVPNSSQIDTDGDGLGDACDDMSNPAPWTEVCVYTTVPVEVHVYHASDIPAEVGGLDTMGPAVVGQPHCVPLSRQEACARPDHIEIAARYLSDMSWVGCEGGPADSTLEDLLTVRVDGVLVPTGHVYPRGACAGGNMQVTIEACF